MATRTVKAYFNHGGLARPSARVARRVRTADREFAGLLYSEDGGRRLDTTLAQARIAARSLLGAGESGGVSLLPNSSTALNLAISILGATLGSGEIAVTTDQEHPCVMWPLSRLGARGVEVATLGGGSPAGFLENLRALIQRRRPGFAVFSHVSCKDGRILPVEEAGAILAQQEIPHIVDGAQALGQVAVDVARIEAWAYAFTGHKWLFGPMGTGGLGRASDFCAPTRSPGPGRWALFARAAANSKADRSTARCSRGWPRRCGRAPRNSCRGSRP